MIIYGKPIAEKIYARLIPQIEHLQKKSISPTLKIILVGNNPQSIIYVFEKQKRGEEIGVNVFIDKKKDLISTNQLTITITNYNNDPNVHGIIIQLPLPIHLPTDQIIATVSPQKDVDGFFPNSCFVSPVAKAIIYILEEVVKKEFIKKAFRPSLGEWLRNKHIIIIGKGKTGGAPIFKELSKIRGINIIQIDRSTKNPDSLIKTGDIVISCVGKKGIVNNKNCKKGAVIISVGLGDFDEGEISDIASFYTPNIGGVGPLTVACLFENLIAACKM